MTSSPAHRTRRRVPGPRPEAADGRRADGPPVEPQSVEPLPVEPSATEPPFVEDGPVRIPDTGGSWFESPRPQPNRPQSTNPEPNRSPEARSRGARSSEALQQEALQQEALPREEPLDGDAEQPVPSPPGPRRGRRRAPGAEPEQSAAPAEDGPVEPLPSPPGPRRGRRRAPGAEPEQSAAPATRGPAEPAEPGSEPDPEAGPRRGRRRAAEAEAEAEPAEVDEGPGYTLPPVPEASWTLDSGRRRSWVSRALLIAILAIQTAMSVRLSNTAFQDEALYMYAGHAQLSHWMYGTPVPKDYNTYFSGSPTLYPIVAAVVENHFGMLGVRLFSLLSMLGSTALLYGFTRRLFNERVALGAAAMFAVTQSTVVLGFFATYDAPAVLLLALAIWIVVRSDRAPAAVVLAAAPVAVLAVGLKYASALYLPSLVLLAVLTGRRNGVRQPMLRGVLLAGGSGALLWLGMTFTDVLKGVQATTTQRAHGTEPWTELARQCVEFSGLMFVTAVGGAIAYALRGRMNESPLVRTMTGPGRRRRVLLGLLLTGTALLAPAYQMHLHTSVALYKHLGFGLLFAAPMAGIGLARLVGPHFRHPQLGILLWVVALALGLTQSTWRFDTWPDSTRMTEVLRQHVTSTGRYLASADNVPVYYTRDLTLQSQWTSTYGIGYVDKADKLHTGDDGYRTAIADGWFDLVVLDGVATPDTDRVVAEAIAQSPHYRLLGRIPFTHVGGTGYYRIWVKQ
ncbi:glycosyltransferase family 39 protein [Kitasatospora sp. NPDC052868]|uniref:glycosyltransferase family 39 protein n=1 Tax=Kitasatospora sp. NPDC052868 TaxID=3364060 RepID=UPI0037CA38F9